MNVDQNGIVWVGTDGGIYRNSIEGSGIFELIDGVDEVLDLFQDGEGFLWTGTNEGMARYKNPELEKSLKEKVFRAMIYTI